MSEPVLWDEPWLVREAVRWLDLWLKPEMSVFEWGSGSSTIWFARRVASVTTVDADARWTEAVKRVALTQALAHKIDAMTVPGEPPGFAEYAAAIDLNYKRYDLILIDGENGSRRACAERSIGRLASPHAVLVLDNSGSAEHIDATRYLTPFFSNRLAMVGEVAQPSERGRDITETSIFVGPVNLMLGRV